jgi:hypothetical protein
MSTEGIAVETVYDVHFSDQAHLIEMKGLGLKQ